MLLTEFLPRVLGAVPVGDVTRALARRPLIRSEIGGRKTAITTEMLALESRLTGFAKGAAATCRLAILTAHARATVTPTKGEGIRTAYGAWTELGVSQFPNLPDFSARGPTQDRVTGAYLRLKCPSINRMPPSCHKSFMIKSYERAI